MAHDMSADERRMISTTCARVATPVGDRYMGPDRDDEFGARNAVPGELLVRVTPTRVVTRAAMTD
jgi:hypothetical protein